jgi:hypothetical protein
MVMENIGASCMTIRAESANISTFFSISIFAETTLAINDAITIPITIDHRAKAMCMLE